MFGVSFTITGHPRVHFAPAGHQNSMYSGTWPHGRPSRVRHPVRAAKDSARFPVGTGVFHMRQIAFLASFFARDHDRGIKRTVGVVPRLTAFISRRFTSSRRFGDQLDVV